MRSIAEADRESRERYETLAAHALDNLPTAEEKAWIRRLRRVLKDQPAALSLVAYYDSLGIVRDHEGVAVQVDTIRARLRDD